MKRAGRPDGGRSRGGAAGATLVEVLFAALIFLVLAVAGAALLYHSRAGIWRQRSRRLAIEAADTRLETLRATAYDQLAGLLAPPDYADHYLRPAAGGGWVASSSDPGETVSLAGQTRAITTVARFLDVQGDSNSYDCLQLTVSVGFGRDADERITLDTCYAP